MRAVPALLAAVLLLAAAPSAGAAALLTESSGDLLALTAGPGAAYAVVGSGSLVRPFTLLRSGGHSTSFVGRFGTRGSVFPDAAAGPGGVLVAFGQRTSDGLRYESSLATAGRLGKPAALGDATGPARVALVGASRLAAFPDIDGDAVLGGVDPAGAPRLDMLTSTGPERRQTPLGLIVSGGRALVLDLDQSGSSTQLRVLGPGAPAAPVVSVPGVRSIDATFAADKEHIYVAYRSGSRAVLASAVPLPGAPWAHRTIATRKLDGAPAVARVGLRTVLATSELLGGRRDVVVRILGPAGTRVDRLTRSAVADVGPLATAGPDDAVYVAWTRRGGRGNPPAVLLQRVA